MVLAGLAGLAFEVVFDAEQMEHGSAVDSVGSIVVVVNMAAELVVAAHRVVEPVAADHMVAELVAAVHRVNALVAVVHMVADLVVAAHTVVEVVAHMAQMNMVGVGHMVEQVAVDIHLLA